MYLPFDESPDDKATRRFVGFIAWLCALIVFAAIVASAEAGGT